MVIFVILFLATLRPPLDPDLFWHVAAGRYVASHGPAGVDMLTGRGEWVQHEWLTEWGMALAHDYFGLWSLSVMFAIVGAAGLFLAVWLHEPEKRQTAAAVALWVAVASQGWGPRPQVLSIFFVALLLFLLEKKPYLAMYLALPIMLFWANMHGGYMMFFVLVGLYIIFKPEIRAECVGAMVFGGLGALLNPHGHQIFTYSFSTVSNSFLSGFIVEWASPSLREPLHWPFFALFFSCYLAMAYSTHRPAGLHMGLLALATVMGFLSVRHIPIAGVLLLIAIPPYLPQINVEIPRPVMWVAPIVALIAVLNISTINPAVTYPAVDVLPSEQIFNEYDWGGWLIYNGKQPYIDGRAQDIYSTEQMKLYQDIKAGREPMPDHVTHALLRPGWLSNDLIGKGWEEIYVGNNVVILARQ